MNKKKEIEFDVEASLILIRQMGAIRTGFYPIVESGDVSLPTVSKYGGSICKLPNETFISCCEDERSFINVVQLYIPTLPDEIKKLFPESKRDCLLVYQVCNQCLSWENPVVKLYSPKDFEKLEYSSSSNDFAPSRVIEWKPYESMMYDLQLSNLSAKLISEGKSSFFPENDSDQYHEHFLEKTRSHFEKIHPRHSTNLGSFPDFIQDDETPEGFKIIANFEQDEVCDLLWGDCGTAQLWIQTQGENVELKATWACS